MQFYKQLLWSDKFRRRDGKESINPKILYSYLAEKALIGSPEMYDREGGCFDSSKIPLMENTYLPLPAIHPTRIAEDTNLSRRFVYDGMKSLTNAGLISEGQIFTIPELFSMGYIPLLTRTKLCGMDLLLYSYLIYRKDESSRRAGCNLTEIDVFREKLSAELNTNIHTISKSLIFLANEMWIKRKPSCNGGFVKWWISFYGCREISGNT